MFPAIAEIGGLMRCFVAVVIITVAMLRAADSWVSRLKAGVILLSLGSFCICTAAWLIGGAVAAHHGGYTHGGRVENGVYFVRYKSEYTAVSKETWEFLESVEFWTGGWTFGIGALGFLSFLAWTALCHWKNSKSVVANRDA